MGGAAADGHAADGAAWAKGGATMDGGGNPADSAAVAVDGFQNAMTDGDGTYYFFDNAQLSPYPFDGYHQLDGHSPSAPQPDGIPNASESTPSSSSGGEMGVGWGGAQRGMAQGGAIGGGGGGGGRPGSSAGGGGGRSLSIGTGAASAGYNFDYGSSGGGTIVFRPPPLSLSLSLPPGTAAARRRSSQQQQQQHHHHHHQQQQQQQRQHSDGSLATFLSLTPDGSAPSNVTSLSSSSMKSSPTSSSPTPLGYPQQQQQHFNFGLDSANRDGGATAAFDGYSHGAHVHSPHALVHSPHSHLHSPQAHQFHGHGSQHLNHHHQSAVVHGGVNSPHQQQHANSVNVNHHTVDGASSSSSSSNNTTPHNNRHSPLSPHNPLKRINPNAHHAQRLDKRQQLEHPQNYHHHHHHQLPSHAPAMASALAPAAAAAGTGSAVHNNMSSIMKRKDWQAGLIAELKALIQIVDPSSIIQFSSESLTEMTGWATAEIAGVSLRELVHQDDVGILVSEISEAVATGRKLRLTYRLRRKDGTYLVLDAVGHAHFARANFNTDVNEMDKSPFCQAIFLVSRPYSTTHAHQLDSFLEHKMEHIRLERRIADLRAEEEEAEAEEERRQLAGAGTDGASDMQSEFTLGTASTGNTVVPIIGATGPGGQQETAVTPGVLSLTQEALDATGSSQPDSLWAKIARYEASHAASLERYTGRLPDGGGAAEGLSGHVGSSAAGAGTGTGAPSGPLHIQGDVGIAISVDRDPRTGEKKKKLRTTEEYLCTDCGTLDSPEWRKGPKGPKTLCNACGLRWAKREKKNGSERRSRAE
jgi:PAS domain S-box-containing protein